jgi:hypothetical protein
MTNLEKTSKFIKALNLEDNTFYAITIYSDRAVLNGRITSALLRTFNIISSTGQIINGNVEFLIEDNQEFSDYKFNIVLC